MHWGIHGGARDERSLSVQFLHFHAVFVKLRNNRLASPSPASPWEILLEWAIEMLVGIAKLPCQNIHSGNGLCQFLLGVK